MASTMDRREAIKTVSMLLGGAFATSSGLLGAVERAHARSKNLQQVGAFTAQDIALLDEVADTILPETKTPGAKAAHTGAFMALMVTDTYSDRDAATFRDGLKQLSGGGFMQLAPPQPLMIDARLTEIEQRPGTERVEIASRFHMLIMPTARVRSTSSCSLKCFFVSS